MSSFTQLEYDQSKKPIHEDNPARHATESVQ